MEGQHIGEGLDDVGTLRNETTIQVHKAKELVEFGERGREREFMNGFEGLDAVCRYLVSKKGSRHQKWI